MTELTKETTQAENNRNVSGYSDQYPDYDKTTVRAILLRNSVNLIAMVNFDASKEYAGLIMPFKVNADYNSVDDVKINYSPWEPIFFVNDGIVRMSSDFIVAMNFPEPQLYNNYCALVYKNGAQEYLINRYSESVENKNE